MPWPTVPIITTGMDADTDALPRSDILDLATKFNQLIAMRGVASGVCDLDGSGLVPNARLAANLVAEAGLVGAADEVSYYTGSGAKSLTTMTAFARTILDDADAVTVRATLGVGTGNGTVTGVTGTAPVVSSGGTAPAISMAAASAGANGYMTSTYAAKLDGIAAGATVGVSKDVGVHGVGCIVMAASSASVTSGNTVLGSALYAARVFGDTGGGGVSVFVNLINVGTWRNISGFTSTGGSSAAADHAFFQRIS